jgi:hypothetical protein
MLITLILAKTCLKVLKGSCCRLMSPFILLEALNV